MWHQRLEEIGPNSATGKPSLSEGGTTDTERPWEMGRMMGAVEAKANRVRKPEKDTIGH